MVSEEKDVVIKGLERNYVAMKYVRTKKAIPADASNMLYVKGLEHTTRIQCR